METANVNPGSGRSSAASWRIEPIPKANLLHGSLTFLGVVLVALYVVVIMIRNTPLQWDFQTYLAAARAALAGCDPYLPENLSRFSGRESLPFVYPAPALVPFLAMAALPSAAAVWIIAKAALLVTLISVWKRAFLTHVSLLALVLVAVFGWNSASLWDMRSGNVALIECALLWIGFAYFALGQRTIFTCLVVAAACFKLLPAAFLLLLLVPDAHHGPSPKRLLAAVMALVMLILTPMLIGPATQWGYFFEHVPSANTLGPSNPSALGLMTALLNTVGFTEAVVPQVSTAVWCAYSIGLLAASIPFLRRMWRLRDSKAWVMAAVFLYVLLSPRPMAYGFVLLVPAPLFFAPQPFNRPAGRLVLALVLAAQGLTSAAHRQSDSLAFTYAPILLTLCVWLLVVNSGTRRRLSRGGPRSSQEGLVATAC